MTFNPQEHLTSIKGKDYLEVKWRLVWFREEHPEGRIATEITHATEQLIVFKAHIYTGNGVILASGHGTAPLSGEGVWTGRAFEKAETAAIGRALAHAGYGTQFTGEEEGEHLADSPVTPKEKTRQSGERQPTDGYKPGAEVRGFLQSFEIRLRDGTDKRMVLCKVKQATTGKIVPVWAFNRDEFVTQGYMDRDDPQWLQVGNGLEFLENFPAITLVAGENGYWEIKPNSLTHKALLGNDEDIPL